MHKIANLPNTYKRLMVKELSTNFAQATQIVRETMPTSLRPFDALVRVQYVGINASDVNFTNGKYLPGVKPPFPAGFECVGRVVAMGQELEKQGTIHLNQPVAASQFGAFSEYLVVPAKHLIPIPVVEPLMLSLMVCGATAATALWQLGELKKDQVVLVTAAAGGTGHIAVQIAKQRGCHVIGTTSNETKADFLKSIGCDRVINYRTENVYQVLKKEYKRGVDLVFECVGGQMFEDALNNMAVKGRIIVIGSISGYKDASSFEGGKTTGTPLPMKLLRKSLSLCGFFLNDYPKEVPASIRTLYQQVKENKLVAQIDPTKFRGLEDISRAIDLMYDRKNLGKVVVEIAPELSSSKL